MRFTSPGSFATTTTNTTREPIDVAGVVAVVIVRESRQRVTLDDAICIRFKTL